MDQGLSLIGIKGLIKIIRECPSESTWRVDRNDAVMKKSAEEDREMVGSFMDWKNVDGLENKRPRMVLTYPFCSVTWWQKVTTKYKSITKSRQSTYRVLCHTQGECWVLQEGEGRNAAAMLLYSQMEKRYYGKWGGTVGGCAKVRFGDVSDVKYWVIRKDMSKEKSDGWGIG